MDSSSIMVVPQQNDDSFISWLLKTRKYIPSYEARKTYFLLKNNSPENIPTIEEWKIAKDSTENRLPLLTALVSSTYFFKKEEVLNYLGHDESYDLGLALAINFEFFDIFIENVKNNQDIILYLENINLMTDDLPLIPNDLNLLKDISKRIIDKNKVMFHILINNFFKITSNKIKLINMQDIFEKEFITKYIEHANFYKPDIFLEYILNNFTKSHPLMEEMDGLAWDPFTKSRRYSHWLQVKSRMNELLRYYININSTEKTILANQNYILKYQEYMKISINNSDV